MSDKTVDPPWFGYSCYACSISSGRSHTANIAGVKNSFAVTFDKKHHRTGAMIRIQKRDPDQQPGSELDLGGRV